MNYGYNDTTKIGESKRGKVVTAADNSETLSWYGLYKKSQTIYSKDTNGVTSTMITGSQYDQTMIWMRNVKNRDDNSKYYLIDSTGMGYYITANGETINEDVFQLSGSNDLYSVKNVYDLAGNHWEATTEANSNYYRVWRGSQKGGNGVSNPVTCGTSPVANRISPSVTTRVILY